MKRLVAMLMLVASGIACAHDTAIIWAISNEDGGYIYLLPGASTHGCADSFGDAYADDTVNQETKHGCYVIEDGDVVILTDDHQGVIIPLRLFKRLEDA